MKIVAISDTHDQHDLIKIPECDVLVVAGDFTSPRIPNLSNYTKFAAWLGSQPAKHKLVVAGNHDTLFERDAYVAGAIIGAVPGATYLQDSGITIDGIKFWGSPWTPFFNAWAFMLPDEQLQKYFDLIPDDTDVLITHGPAFGVLDQFTTKGETEAKSVGSVALRNRVDELKLKAHFFGHIHEAYGKEGNAYNVAQCDGDYDITNPPVVVEIDK